VEEFVACFAEVVDPRQDNARHDLHELLMIALCTLLSGGEDCSDMALFGEIKAPYLRQFLRLRHGTPSHDTFSRVFRLLEPKAFETCFTRFMQRFSETLRGVVQGYRIWVLPNCARRRVRKVSSHAARMRFAFMDSVEPSSLARLRARRRSRAMFCGP
jgi:hypothetical protein